MNAVVNPAGAVDVAEQQANVRAPPAEYAHSKHGWVYVLDVVSERMVFDVRVDAGKGTVIWSVEDNTDELRQRNRAWRRANAGAGSLSSKMTSISGWGNQAVIDAATRSTASRTASMP